MNYEKKLEKYTYKKSIKNNILYDAKYKYYKNIVGGFNSLPMIYLNALDNFIKDYNKNENDVKKQIDESHGLSHALMVLCHADKAIQSYNEDGENHNKIPDTTALKIKLAALLHDADDSKYFPNNMNYENARKILKECQVSDNDIEDIIQMISWVSSSKNGDKIPNEAIGKEYLLYPRYADRLEALGIIGLERTLHYTKSKNAPLYIEKVPQPNITIEDIYRDIATEERYANYTKSISMMDHFYDKLLRLGKYPIRNKYFDEECKIRQKPLEDIAVLFEEQGQIKEEDIHQYIEANPVKKCSCENEVSNLMTNIN